MLNTGSENYANSNDHPEWRKHDPMAYTVPNAMRVSGLGRTLLYEKMRSGELASRSVGRRRLIDAASLRALVTGEVA